MPALAETTLSDVERRVLDRLLPRLEETVALRAVWLFGSRARGEEPRDADSDVDLLVVTTGGRADVERVRALVHEVAEGERNANPWAFNAHVIDPEWLAERRAIDAFFIREVERDKVVLYGGEDLPETHLPENVSPPTTARGLRQRSEEYLETAHGHLRSARLLLEGGETSNSVSNSYYAGFEAARAALSEEDLFARTHDGTWHLFHRTFVATGRFDAQLHARAHAAEKPRMAVTYEGLFVGAEGAEAFLDTAERFVAAVESLLGLPDHA